MQATSIQKNISQQSTQLEVTWSVEQICKTLYASNATDTTGAFPLHGPAQH